MTARATGAMVLGATTRELGHRLARILSIGPPEISGPHAAELIIAMLPLARLTPEQAVEVLRSMLTSLDDHKHHEAIRACCSYFAERHRSLECRLDLLDPSEAAPPGSNP